jgi:hypothetical protein
VEAVSFMVAVPSSLVWSSFGPPGAADHIGRGPVLREDGVDLAEACAGRSSMPMAAGCFTRWSATGDVCTLGHRGTVVLA